jgi:hypothetical protein
MHVKLGIICLLVLLLPLQSVLAGGGCTFSNTCSGATNITCSTNYSMSNSSCTIATECCGCWANCTGSCDACSSPPEHHDDCNTTAMGISCFIEGTFCGSPENTQWGRFCATNTGSHTFNYNSVNCSGGGVSLQVGLYDQGITCASTDQSNMQFCNGSLTGSTSVSANLVAGQCYILVFDGNAGAECTWTFSVICPIFPVVLKSFTAEKTSDRTISLFWETESEQDSKEFTITRRYDDLQRESGKSWDEEMNDREVTVLPAVPSKAQGDHGASYSLMDNAVNLPGQYTYELYQHDFDGTNHYMGVAEVFVGTPAASSIVSAYYAAASEAVRVEYSVNDRLPVVATLYDIGGKQVGTDYLGMIEPGFHTMQFDAGKLQPGIYLIDLKIGGKSERRKVLVR